MQARRVSEHEVRQVAALARLDLDEAEVGRLALELDAVLDNAARLDDLLAGASGGSPCPPAAGCAEREDSARDGMGAAALLDQAPEESRGLVPVPAPDSRSRGEGS